MTAAIDGVWRNQKPKPAAPPARVDAAPTSQPPLLLTAKEAAAFLNIGLRTFHELRSKPFMPKPIVLGPQTLRWHRQELMESMSARAPRQVDSEEPVSLQAARATREVAA